jgi:hypothetical protein
MSIAQKLGHSDFGSRDLYALNLRHYQIPHDVFKEITGHFIACLAIDGTEATDKELKEIASDLIQAGCTYICCWGPDCERVHDLIDLEDLDLHPAGPWNMTTWQNDVPLSEALWFSINSAWPDSAFEETTHSVVGISFNNTEWFDEISEAYSNPVKFSQKVLKQ